MTELSFLIDLLLNHELQKQTKDAIAERIKQVEAALTATRMVVPLSSGVRPEDIRTVPAHLANQSPSTIAAMIRHEQNGEAPPMPTAAATAPLPVQPQVIAQTPAAVAAVNARQQAIQQAISGKPAPGETRPRKF